MTKQTLAVGAFANDGTGDKARAGFVKIQANFDEIYTAFGDGSTLTPFTPETNASVKIKYEANADTNALTDANLSKLNGIENLATADQTGAEIKLAYESEPNTNAFTDADLSKLVGIEPLATADMTGAEIKVSYESIADTNAFTDAEKTKLGNLTYVADPTASSILGFETGGSRAWKGLGSGLQYSGGNLDTVLKSDPTGVTGATTVNNIIRLTQAQYDAIATPNATTIYAIVG